MTMESFERQLEDAVRHSPFCQMHLSEILPMLKSFPKTVQSGVTRRGGVRKLIERSNVLKFTKNDPNVVELATVEQPSRVLVPQVLAGSPPPMAANGSDNGSEIDIASLKDSLMGLASSYNDMIGFVSSMELDDQHKKVFNEMRSYLFQMLEDLNMITPAAKSLAPEDRSSSTAFSGREVVVSTSPSSEFNAMKLKMVDSPAERFDCWKSRYALIILELFRVLWPKHSKVFRECGEQLDYMPALEICLQVQGRLDALKGQYPESYFHDFESWSNSSVLWSSKTTPEALNANERAHCKLHKLLKCTDNRCRSPDQQKPYPRHMRCFYYETTGCNKADCTFGHYVLQDFQPVCPEFDASQCNRIDRAAKNTLEYSNRYLHILGYFFGEALVPRTDPNAAQRPSQPSLGFGRRLIVRAMQKLFFDGTLHKFSAIELCRKVYELCRAFADGQQRLEPLQTSAEVDQDSAFANQKRCTYANCSFRNCNYAHSEDERRPFPTVFPCFYVISDEDCEKGSSCWFGHYELW